ncbi:heavy metal-associated isoprenylated plant protein 47-like [Phragmites australis]|uniref:heavy metal-associated isoprenylated plant protein 47-like n=1 Tax=Phragmites australis TaxID=29695 RepID=UPI002D77BD9B|nr:heavy metal-associated isoprenylated plant protein 47-like [Phragmites australis]
MKQKIVIKVHLRCDKCRKKALGIAASTHGVESVGIEGEEKDQLVVVGDGVDATSLTYCLRRKVGRADIVKVEPVGAEEATKPADEQPAIATVAASPQQWYPHPGYYYSRPAVVYPYAGHCYADDSHTEPWCTIL